MLAGHPIPHLLSFLLMLFPLPNLRVRVRTCSAVHLHIKAVLKQQVFCSIKAIFPFKFFLLSREQLLVFYLLLCSFSAR